VAKNVNLEHIEEVTLRRHQNESALWRVPAQVIKEASNSPEFDQVLDWCVQGPTSRHILTIFGVMNSTSLRLAELQEKLAQERTFSSRVGSRLASFAVGRNWEEESWLTKAEGTGFFVEEIVRELAMSQYLEEIVLSVTGNPKLFEGDVPRRRDVQTQRISNRLRAFDKTGSFHPLSPFDQTAEEGAEAEQVLRSYLAWALAVTAVSLTIYDALDDVEDPSEDVGQSIELVSVTNLDAEATTGVAQTAERFLGLFSELLQSGKLGEFDQAAGEHSLRQFLGEMQNPEGATGHVVRGYEIKMVEIYHRHIGIQGLRLVADDETVKQVESAITQAIEMGNAVEPEEAAKLAESIPTALLPSLSSREKFTSALGWSSGAALSATVAGAGGAKLIDGLGELGKILPAPWGAMIGAILGLLAYTFKPKGKS
jgi:hypothetical protein